MLHPPKAKSIRSVVPRFDRSLFSRLIVVSQTRSLKLEEVFCFELSALSWSLATVDGGLQKTAKSKMIPLLEKYVTPVQFPLNDTVIFDEMALLQASTPSGTTYAHLALQLFTCITQGTHTGNRIDFVIDRYPNLSIKNWERNRRTSFVTPAVIQIQHRHQKLPRDWIRFLAATANKIALVDFLFKEWQLPEYAHLLNGKCVFVCHGSNCSTFSTNDAVTVTEQLIPALSCSAEEADIRMFLHANHAANTRASRIAIRSPESDVLVIG